MPDFPTDAEHRSIAADKAYLEQQGLSDGQELLSVREAYLAWAWVVFAAAMVEWMTPPRGDDEPERMG